MFSDKVFLKFYFSDGVKRWNASLLRAVRNKKSTAKTVLFYIEKITLT